jgi:hypothetical protein
MATRVIQCTMQRKKQRVHTDESDSTKIRPRKSSLSLHNHPREFTPPPYTRAVEIQCLRGQQRQP